MQLYISVVEGRPDPLAGRVEGVLRAASVDSGSLERWYEADRAVFGKEVVVHAGPQATIGELCDEALRVAHAEGLSTISLADARRVQGGMRDSSIQWEQEFGASPNVMGNYCRLLPGRECVLIGIEITELTDDYQPLPVAETLDRAGFTDGDRLVLRIETMPPRTGPAPEPVPAQALPVPDPETMLSVLQLAATSDSARTIPRLWGVLLYTEADTAVATYVRAQFDELNALTGPLLSVLVMERPASWRTACRYWRQTLEPPLYRAFSAMRWLSWLPYDKHRCHDIARQLDIPPDHLPCLALFPGADTGQRLVFPIRSATPDAFRRLFGAINNAISPLGAEPASPRRPAHRKDPVPYRMGWLPSWRYSSLLRGNAGDDVMAEEAVETVRAITGSAARLDERAFAEVRAAEERILAAIEPVPDRAGRFELYGSTVFIHHGGGSLTENFNFYGQTTFINRPVDTVVKDFQQTYGSVQHQESLSELLRAILTAKLPESEKAQAAQAVSRIATDLAVPDPKAASAKLATLRTTLTAAAGAALPALEIINKLLSLLGH
ncbi:hypothetical protein [Amycolatopsis vancoresmycina]|uniref:Uncharacterized protein n=1 Tax=Amycolatopsis vancoresmycina DSM 44592 TaxID=1292037 RepID=R1GDJ7_9PSEU|nr:hypothetical protein [Amycolatopsis vancoresmycina]EOD69392.1 hypothetical protein H480_06446 [Amycolatopsis vancoresmycina DSM 44592]